MIRQTKLNLALYKTERILNVQGDIDCRSHGDYAKFCRAGVRFSRLLTHTDAWCSYEDRLDAETHYGQVSFLSHKDIVVWSPQMQERGLSGLKAKSCPTAPASSGLGI